MTTSKKTGIVYLIGAGPGDPELLTLRGRDCIKEADTVIYDYLASDQLLQFARKEAEIIFAGKRKGETALPQSTINQLLVEKGMEGRVVARLKGGDPFIFGRGGEEALSLAQAGVPFEIIPGVTSAIAVAAYAGIPLTHRGLVSTVVFASGHEDPSKPQSLIPWSALARDVGTLVFYMGITNLEGIVSNLIKNGRDPKTPIALIRWGTKPEQETLVGTLEDIVQKMETRPLPPPVTIVVGEVVRLREDLNWFENRPLFRKRVLVTRARDQAKGMVAALKRVGAEPVVCSTIQTLPPEDYKKLNQAIARLKTYDWIVFTSANGVRYFFEHLTRLSGDARSLAGVQIAAIGAKTASALQARHLIADLVPKDAIAEGLVEAFTELGVKGKRFLIPRAREAREILPDELGKKGAHVDVVETYRTVQSDLDAAQLHEDLKNGKLDVITFTSASTVKNFVEMMGRSNVGSLLDGIVIGCIGPITQDAAEALGLRVHVLAKERSVLSLVEALIDYYNKGEGP